MPSPVQSATLVIAAKNERGWLHRTLESISHAKVQLPFDVVVVDDGSTDGGADFFAQMATENNRCHYIHTEGLGISRASNLGAEQATGDMIVFCDAHILVEDAWLDQIAATMSTTGAGCIQPAVGSIDAPERVGCGFTWNKDLRCQWLFPKSTRPIPLITGQAYALRRTTFVDVGGFDVGFQGWGHMDKELALRLWLFGHSVYGLPSVKVLHRFTAKPNYQRSALDANHNLLRMGVLHFNKARIQRVVDRVKETPSAISAVFDSDARQIRAEYLKRRIRTDDWFMKHFSIAF